MGILVISLLSSMIVFVPVPYLTIIFVAALSGQFDPGLLIAASALGSALGKLVVFQAAYSGQKLVGEDTKRNLNAFKKLFEKYSWVAVFLAASTPIPDDIVYVPLGLARYNRPKFFVATLAGKVVLVAILVLGASFLDQSVIGFFLGGGWKTDLTEIVVVSIIAAAITLLMTYALAKFDWSKWASKSLRNQSPHNHSKS